MRTITTLFLSTFSFIAENSFAALPFDSCVDKDSFAKQPIVQVPVDTITDIESLLNDTTLLEVESDTLINHGPVKTNSITKVPSDPISKHIPKKPVEAIPQSVTELNKIYSDYREYLDFAQDRWDDIYLLLSEIKMKPDYYKFVVPLTYYSKSFEEAVSLDGWYPKDIIVENSVRRASFIKRGMPDMPVSSDLDRRINRQLLDFYVNYPELVGKNETSLDSLDFLTFEEMISAYRKDDIISLIDKNAGFTQMEESDLLVLKPNFWVYGGSGYMQFSQNYISENWYKGGESTKSLLSGFTWQAKYDDKQKTQFESKIEWKLGFTTSPSDTVHSYKANNDLLRLTSKLGYRAIKNWYYTLSAEFQTQLFSSYATNSDNLVSTLLSPATLNIGLGMDYKYAKDGKVNLSILLNPINYTLHSVRSDKVDPTKFNIKEGHKRENEIGSRINTTLTWKIIPSLLWESKFSYTTDYENVFSEWENTFTFILNKYLSTKLFMHGRFDDAVSKEPDESYFQFQELFSFGVNYVW